MDHRTTGVRIMNPTKNQRGRVAYNNAKGQTVNPATGRAISKSDRMANIPLKSSQPLPPTDQGMPMNKKTPIYIFRQNRRRATQLD